MVEGKTRAVEIPLLPLCFTLIDGAEEEGLIFRKGVDNRYVILVLQYNVGAKQRNRFMKAPQKPRKLGLVDSAVLLGF